MKISTESKIDILEFARIGGDESKVTEEENIEQMRRVLPMDDPLDLNAEDAEALYLVTLWLHDYILLLWEQKRVEKSAETTFDQKPWTPGPGGPFIDTMLTRSGPGEFTRLKNFGMGRR